MLRGAGVIAGVLAFLLVFSRFRRGYARLSDMLLGTVISIALLVVSIDPDAINTIRDMFFLVPTQFDRLIVLLLASNFLLWYLVLNDRMALAWQHTQFDRLVRSMISAEFREKYKDVGVSPRIVVVIPAFNEAANIRPVLEKMNESVRGESMVVVMVDDGSSDNSVEILDDLGVLVAISPINRGGGAALRAGYDIAQALGAEIVVTMDADGQHDPAQIDRLVTPILEDKADFVLGSRLLGEREKDSAIRLLGIYVFNFVLRLLTGVRFTDCSNGFRAFRMKNLMQITLRQDQFHTTELIIEAVRKGGRIQEVPVTVSRRLHGTSKKGKNLSYAFNFVRTIVNTWLR